MRICPGLPGFVAILALLSTAAIAQPAPAYRIVEQWTIPNGGYGRVVVVSKPNPTEGDLHALGDKLRQDTKADRNAFVFVYDDEMAASDRRKSISDKLSKAQLKRHNRHRVAMYIRNANTGFHQMEISTKGFDGPSVFVNY